MILWMLADPVGELGGLFDPRTGLRPNKDLDLPAIDVGKKSWPR